MYRPPKALLRPTTLSCHSSTVLDDLRQCTVLCIILLYRPSSVCLAMLMKAPSSYRRVALPSADRTDQTEGDTVSRAGSSRFDDVAFFVPSCTGTWQESSCQLHSAEQPTCTQSPLLQATCWIAESDLLFIPFHKQDCTRTGFGRIERYWNVEVGRRAVKTGRAQQERYMGEWILLYVAFCRIMALSYRSKPEAGTMPYSYLEWLQGSTVP